MSDDEEKQRLVDDFIDEWLLSVDDYRQSIDGPEDPAQRYVPLLEESIAAVRRARAAGDQLSLLFWAVFLGKLMVTVTSAQWDHFDDQWGHFDDQKDCLFDKLRAQADVLANYAGPLAIADVARLRALAAGRQTQQKKRGTQLEAARAEFERMVSGGLSRRRASTIAGERYGLHPETLRRRRK